MKNYLTKSAIDAFIGQAFLEDVGAGDHSTLASVPADATNVSYFLFKASGILAGAELAKRIFLFQDPTLAVELLKRDGDWVEKGELALKISGSAQAMLTAERLALNCMQRMSGIATLTNSVAKQLEGTKTKVLDTRKTTPNFRMMEKWAVKIGGGENHRFGLYDLIMLKDNHIDFAGSITKAVNQTATYLQRKNLSLKIEVETRNLDEVKEALSAQKVDIIMLDNMDLATMTEAVRLIGGNCQTEASGGIIANQVADVAACGVDFISMGALTHSAPILDISMKAEKALAQ